MIFVRDYLSIKTKRKSIDIKDLFVNPKEKLTLELVEFSKLPLICNGVNESKTSPLLTPSRLDWRRSTVIGVTFVVNLRVSFLLFSPYKEQVNEYGVSQSSDLNYSEDKCFMEPTLSHWDANYRQCKSPTIEETEMSL